jgi:hypothetical protein
MLAKRRSRISLPWRAAENKRPTAIGQPDLHRRRAILTSGGSVPHSVDGRSAGLHPRSLKTSNQRLGVAPMQHNVTLCYRMQPKIEIDCIFRKLPRPGHADSARPFSSSPATPAATNSAPVAFAGEAGVDASQLNDFKGQMGLFVQICIRPQTRPACTLSHIAHNPRQTGHPPLPTRHRQARTQHPAPPRGARLCYHENSRQCCDLKPPGSRMASAWWPPSQDFPPECRSLSTP